MKDSTPEETTQQVKSKKCCGSISKGMAQMMQSCGSDMQQMMVMCASMMEAKGTDCHHREQGRD